MTRFTIEVWYNEDEGEDLGAVANALADLLFEQEGVEQVALHGPRSHVVSDPTVDVIERGI